MSEIGNDKSLTKFGLYGAIIGFIPGIYRAFIFSLILPFLQDVNIIIIISNIVSAISLVSFVLLTIGYIGLAKGLNNESYRKILILLLAVVLIFDLVDTILGLSTGRGINWGAAGFLQAIVVWAPALILFVMYWNDSIYAKILVVLRIIRIIIYLIPQNAPIGSIPYGTYVGFAEKIILLIWFSKGVNLVKVERVPSSSPVSSAKVETEIKQGIYQETEPGAHGIHGIARSSLFHCHTGTPGIYLASRAPQSDVSRVRSCHGRRWRKRLVIKYFI